jgi:hypothetical protein
LAKGLARHRQALSMGVILAALSEEAASAAVPASLLGSTIQDALRIAAGQTVATPAAVLMKEVMQMMLLTKLKLVTMCLAAVGVMGVLAASFFGPMRAADEKPTEPKSAPQPAAKETLASTITRLDNDIGDVASLLKIYKRVCEVELQPLKKSTTLGVDIEVYKDGRKRNTYKPITFSNVGNLSGQKPIRVKVAVLAADLDYLPLADARKNHCRVQVDFALPGAQSSSAVDVDKEMFDFTHTAGGGWFPREAGSATETPLFWDLARSRVIADANTVPEIRERNPKGDLLIVYLRVRKE